ncbi:GGDEF domain-containing protein [Erwinia sp. SLM-02]|uniref:GGDEF domain-containing protein n=1 Tax=Erwinia sp. SLM-02 TaxID=3020057 RepID=UPI00307FD724
MVMLLHLMCFPMKQRGEGWIDHAGWVFDGLQLLALNVILWSFNRLLMKPRLRLLINTGLIIWIVSAAFDVMDEIVRQPLWVGYYIEDVTQLVGMLSVTLGVFYIVRYLNDKYANASIDSFRDELTSLPNRRYFMTTLRELTDDALFVFLIDIDFFKKINDSFGHDRGDDVLRGFGKMLSSFYDDNILACRIGGEEFAVIVNTTDIIAAQQIAGQLLSCTRTLVIADNIRFTVSIGACLKKEQESVKEVLKRADVALYQAKSGGRNRVQWAGTNSKKPA